MRSSAQKNNMKLKKITAYLVAAVLSLFTLTACGTSEQDQIMTNKLVGGWILADESSFEYDADGNLITIDVYEFTPTQIKYHVASINGAVSSVVVNDYTVSGGKIKVVADGKVQYAKIVFADNGNLLWYTDDSANEFRKITQEEIDTFAIPLGTDAGVLGVDRTTDTQINTEAADTSAQDTSAETASDTAA